MAGALARLYTVAEFFCGCGGTSHGFQRSSMFKVVLGNDIKRAALRTFELNHSTDNFHPATIPTDIRTVPIADIVAKLLTKGVPQGELDCLIGGPPCQGFSQMRRSEERNGEMVRFKGYDRLAHDHRNDLVLRFLEIAHAVQPKFILIENVPQMRTHAYEGERGGLVRNIREILIQMGYESVVDVLNAADYGVPQLRERMFIVASRVCAPSFPPVTHFNPEDPGASFLKARGLLPWITVENAIADLPPDPPFGEDTFGGGPLDDYPRMKISEYANRMRSHRRFPFNHVTRQYSDRILKIIRHMKPGETWDSASERMQAKYRRLASKQCRDGETLASALARLKRSDAIIQAFFRRYYWSAYTRLDWTKPALTITANCNFLGSGRFTHPDRNRGITMREAARLQSFDDDFQLITGREALDTANIGIGLDMIGEAVPPLVGEAFARHIASALQLHHRRQQREVVILEKTSAQEQGAEASAD